MSRFRQNHQRSSRGSGFLAKGLLMSVILIVFMVYIFYQLKDQIVDSPQTQQNKRYEITYESDIEDQSQFYEAEEDRDYLPQTKGNLIHHTYYSLDYNEQWEQANWVAYRLTKASLLAPNVKRSKRFNYDAQISSRSAVHSDYTHSGYTRGHMAPAGDMAFNQVAMTESFLMSNMSPQLRGCNNGIWKELEENVRDWAFDNDELIVVSGPIFYSKNPKKIGKKNKVAVPDAFFKILVDNEGSEKKSIAFVIPNDIEDDPLSEFAVSIDEVEKLTGIDFFYNYDENGFDNSSLESEYNIKQWKVDKKRYKQRVNNWNNQK